MYINCRGEIMQFIRQPWNNHILRSNGSLLWKVEKAYSVYPSKEKRVIENTEILYAKNDRLYMNLHTGMEYYLASDIINYVHPHIYTKNGDAIYKYNIYDPITPLAQWELDRDRLWFTVWEIADATLLYTIKKYGYQEYTICMQDSKSRQQIPLEYMGNNRIIYADEMFTLICDPQYTCIEIYASGIENALLKKINIEPYIGYLVYIMDKKIILQDNMRIILMGFNGSILDNILYCLTDTVYIKGNKLVKI